MLSSLSALIDRTFVVGFVVPTTTLIAAISIIFDDLEAVKKLTTAVTAVDGFQAVFIPLLGLWLCAILLEMLNTTIYRALEGYIWPMNRNSWKIRSQRRLQKINNDIERMRNELVKHPGNGGLIEEYTKSARFRAVMFPHVEEYVLPTRFGNVIRAFEQYPKSMYGADGIAIWPLLLNVLPEDAKAQVSRSRAYVDLLVNLCAISFFLGVFVTFWGAAHGISAYMDCSSSEKCVSNSLKAETRYFASGILLIVFSRIWYEFSIRFALAWGTAVKSAFDVNLSTLAKKLPFPFPSEPDKETDFWVEVTQQVLYSQRFNRRDEKTLGDTEAALGDGKED